MCWIKCVSSGVPWTIPNLLPVSGAVADKLEVGAEIAIKDNLGAPIAVLTLREKLGLDKQHLVKQVYRTDDTAHPGVAYTMSTGDVYLAGPLAVLADRKVEHQEYNLTPAETRAAFESRGWKRIVAFQTRNPIHRAHEYLTKCALEMCDGLLVHPLMGATKVTTSPGMCVWHVTTP